MPKTGLPAEYKTLPAITLVTDEAQGIVEHIVALTGNVDLGKDRIVRGAFVKTIAERGHKIRVLDHHQTGSITHVLGRPLEVREVGRDELPPEVLARYPQVTGGLRVKTQFAIETPKGKAAFDLIRGGYVDEYSIGFDPLDIDYTNEVIDGKRATIRDIKTIRLWEYSPVLWGMNEGTTTISAKDVTGAEDTKEDTVSKTFKALDFLTAFESRQTRQQLADLRWAMESAFNECLASIVDDENLDLADKKVACEQAATQYGTALGAWAGSMCDMASSDESGEVMSAKDMLTRPTDVKYGKRISKATRSVLEAALGAITTLLAVDANETDEGETPSETDAKPDTNATAPVGGKGQDDVTSPQTAAGPTDQKSPTELEAELLSLEASLYSLTEV